MFKHILNRALAHIVRFSATPQHFPESVAEHSFYTSYFTALICKLLEGKGENVDTAKAISMALIHDTEERFSGDILSPFKHYSPEVTNAIKKVNNEVIDISFEGLPDSLKEYYISLWKEEGKGESIEARVVKMADRLSLISKSAEEVKAGNKFFVDIYEDQLKAFQEYDYPWWVKIRDDVLS